MRQIICITLILVFGLGLSLFGEEQKAPDQKNKPKPAIKEVGGYWYAYMDFQGPYSILGEKSNATVVEFRKQKLKAVGEFMIMFYNPPDHYRPEDYRWAPCIPIAEDTEVKPPLMKRKFEKTMASVIIHDYDRKFIAESNQAARKYIKELGFKELWPVYEIFHRSPPVVEVIYPIGVEGKNFSIKEKINIKGGYNFGVMGEGQERSVQWWLNDHQAALEIENFRIIMDREAQQMSFLNLPQKTYVKTSLPLDAAALLDENTAKTQKFYKVEGAIKKTEEKKDIRQKTCWQVLIDEKICNLSDQPTYHNKCFYDREQKAMVTRDVAFNWQLKNELAHNLRLFFNPQEDYLVQLRQLDGYIYESQNTIYMRGNKISYSVQAEEIRPAEPPAGIYGIPEGFKEKKGLDLTELFIIINLVYGRGI